jgi:hypothetical protein
MRQDGPFVTEEYDELIDSLDEVGLDKDAIKVARATLRLFHKTIHDRDLITYYEEENQSLEQVLNIFIRMNSGGTPLSYSDLLLSVAVAQWEKVDAREAIHSLVDEMNKQGDGFKFTKDGVVFQFKCQTTTGSGQPARWRQRAECLVHPR